MQEPYYTAEAVSKMLHIHIASIRRMCVQGKFEGARKFGRAWYIPRTSIDPASPPQKPATPRALKESSE